MLRCRLDGTGLEVFSTGTRNHLEPNLDDRDNLFTYDNTDDGLGWWTRVTHHIDGGYYGYPFDYHTRTDRMLPRMAEYGGGSPCGGVFYGEDAWPEKYRGRALLGRVGQARRSSAFRFDPDGRDVQGGRRRSTSSSPATSTTSARSTWRSRTTARRCTSPTGRWAAGATRPRSSGGSTP